jgi:hypothetical protein
MTICEITGARRHDLLGWLAGHGIQPQQTE